MNAPEAITRQTLIPEWRRVEILARCLLMSRSGKTPDSKVVEELKALQNLIEDIRVEQGPWSRLDIAGLPVLALDILACVFAAEAQPKIGLLYQDLQHGSQACISPAMIQVLLALDDHEASGMQLLLHASGELQQRGLIDIEGEGALAVLRPRKRALHRLLNWPEADLSPPGAYRVKQSASWDELVLPGDRIQQLKEFMLWIEHKDTVVNLWKGRETGGPVALFSGPSGTGKTFAASVIAQALGWPLYRVDLARLVSKYIGETEKNIGRLFDSAHSQKIVLQFDEVDALMSKRGEIKEARDRYANMEVSYLLSRIEDHRGPCILTTNLRTQIDKAFNRRFQSVIEFPRPDAVARAELWKRMLPPLAPLNDDVDAKFVAEAVTLTGGNIRNAALHSAYLAAGDKLPISLSHIATAIWRELSKDRAQVPKADLGRLANYLPATTLPLEVVQL